MCCVFQEENGDNKHDTDGQNDSGAEDKAD